jgi:hypothetical protein
MTNFIPTTGPLYGLYPVCTVCATRMVSTTRTSWMANNAIPDSIIINMICRSLLPPVEPNEPNVFSTEVGLNSKNTSTILNTINPVMRVFTAMDEAKPDRVNVSPHGAVNIPSVIAPIDASKVAIDEKLRSA